VAESILLCLFSFLLALLFSVAAENAFGWLVRTDVSVREAIDPYTAAGGLLFILLLEIVSGSIPAALISSYRPIEVMKGTFRQKTKMVYSKILIVFQYFITIALIRCTLVMIRQIRFMLRFDMGYGTEALIQADVPGNLMSSYAPLRNDLMTIGGVESVSLATFTPSSGGNNDTRERRIVGRADAYQNVHAIIVVANDIHLCGAYRLAQIAMRKVYGSTNAEVLRLLIAGFMKMVAVGFVLAVPVSMVHHARVAQRLHRTHRYRLAHVRRRRTDCRRDRASDRLLAELPGRQRQSGRLGEKIMGKELSDSLHQ